jgi:hypothetical protein
MDDIRALTEANARFLGAYVVGSLGDLDAVLDPSFIYVDGVTGEVTGHDDYHAELTGPSPTLTFDQVHVHVTGETAAVTGRNARDGKAFRRYVDTNRRVNGRWMCVHGCLWPVPPR